MREALTSLTTIRNIAKNQTDDAPIGQCEFGMCDGSGVAYFPHETPEYGVRAGHCKCRVKAIKRYKVDALVKKANIEGYESMTFENYVPKNTCQVDAKNQLQEHGSYYLFGPNGTGKTHLAIAGAIAAIKKGISTAFLLNLKLLNEIRNNLGKDAAGEIETAAKEINYLVIDDFDKTKVTDWVLEKMFEIVDARYIGWVSGKMCTTFTCNLTIKSLTEKYDSSIADRIAGMCNPIFLDGESYRRRDRV